MQEKKIAFNATALSGIFNYCKISFLKQLLIRPFLITVDGASYRDATESTNSTLTVIEFNLTSSEHKIEIISTDVIPEFSSLILPIFITLTILAVVLAKKKFLDKKTDLNLQTTFF